MLAFFSTNYPNPIYLIFLSPVPPSIKNMIKLYLQISFFVPYLI